MANTKNQQLAIDLEGTNIIVSAGAGSGKTAPTSSANGSKKHRLKRNGTPSPLLPCHAAPPLEALAHGETERVFL